jgi:hypothetical protein
VFDKELFEKFQLVKPLDRDPKSGKYKELDKFSSMLKIIAQKGPGSSDFDGYFKINPWDPKSISKTLNNVISHFINADLLRVYNIEIVGGVIGEFSQINTILNYCNAENISKFPGSVMTCLAHAYPRFKNPKLLNILKDMQQKTVGKIKFNIMDILETIVPSTSLNKENKQVNIEGNPIIHKISIKSLNSLSEKPEYSNTLYPEDLDDIAYMIKFDYLSKYKQEMVIEALLTNAISTIHTEIGFCGLKLLFEYLFDNGLDKNLFDKIVRSQLNIIYEIYQEENPKAAKIIMKILYDLSLKKK